jgi:hypothetical protein
MAIVSPGSKPERVTPTHAVEKMSPRVRYSESGIAVPFVVFVEGIGISAFAA